MKPHIFHIPLVDHEGKPELDEDGRPDCLRIALKAKERDHARGAIQLAITALAREFHAMHEASVDTFLKELPARVEIAKKKLADKKKGLS